MVFSDIIIAEKFIQRMNVLTGMYPGCTFRLAWQEFDSVEELGQQEEFLFWQKWTLSYDSLTDPN